MGKSDFIITTDIESKSLCSYHFTQPLQLLPFYDGIFMGPSWERDFALCTYLIVGIFILCGMEQRGNTGMEFLREIW